MALSLRWAKDPGVTGAGAAALSTCSTWTRSSDCDAAPSTLSVKFAIVSSPAMVGLSYDARQEPGIKDEDRTSQEFGVASGRWRIMVLLRTLHPTCARARKGNAQRVNLPCAPRNQPSFLPISRSQSSLVPTEPMGSSSPACTATHLEPTSPHNRPRRPCYPGRTCPDRP
jgi:hypothetical protein